MTQPSTEPRTLAIPLTLDRLAANPEQTERLEIPVSFASDRIVEDPWLGPVRLSLEASAVDLAQGAAKGIPVREMHQRSLPVGRVMEPRVDGGVMRGLLRFSQSERGRALYRDAIDGILTDLSVGASIFAVREEPDHLVATRWTPREVSLVDEGADQSVGINRALFTPPVTQEPTMADETQAAETRAATTESQNSINILELARYADSRAPELGIQRMGEDFAHFGRSFEEFRTEVWRMLNERQKTQPAVGAPPAAEIGLSHQEAQQFSICRAAMAQLTGDWKKAGFELEASRAVADRIGRPPRGFFVPLEVQRTLSAGVNAAGGYLVEDAYRGDLFIEALRAQSVALGMGVRTLPGLQGNLTLPRQTGVSTFYWLSEGEDVTESEPTFGAVALNPRTIAGAVPMTRRLLMQSSPSIEQLVRQDLITGAALGLDKAIFEGDGIKQPLGIANHPDINTVAIGTDGTPTWAEIVQFETEVETDNALLGSLAYVTTPAVRGKLKVTAKDAGSGLFLSDGNSTNGYPIKVSNQLATHTILFGAWSQIMVGFWGVLDIKPDEAKLAASGGLVLRVFQDADIAVRHGKAFAIGT